MSHPLVVSYGAGDNSLGMLVGYAERGIQPDAIIFADTRGEKPRTYAHITTHLRPWLKQVGFPDLVVVSRQEFEGQRRLRTGDKSLMDECLRLGYMPSRAYGYSTCADKWKLDPFKWWARTQWPHAFIERAIGFDADEASRVDTASDKGFGKVYPLIEWGWTREDCQEAIRARGLPLPGKSACYYCPSSTKTEVIALAREHPILFRRAVRMETAALENGKSRIKGLGRHWSWKALVAADPETQAAMQEAPVEECTQCHLF